MGVLYPGDQYFELWRRGERRDREGDSKDCYLLILPAWRLQKIIAYQKNEFTKVYDNLMTHDMCAIGYLYIVIQIFFNLLHARL